MDNTCLNCSGVGWKAIGYKETQCCICNGTKKYHHNDKPCANCRAKGHFRETIYTRCPYCRGRGERHWIDDIIRPLKDDKCSEDQKNMYV